MTPAWIFWRICFPGRKNCQRSATRKSEYDQRGSNLEPRQLFRQRTHGCAFTVQQEMIVKQKRPAKADLFCLFLITTLDITLRVLKKTATLQKFQIFRSQVSTPSNPHIIYSRLATLLLLHSSFCKSDVSDFSNDRILN